MKIPFIIAALALAIACAPAPPSSNALKTESSQIAPEAETQAETRDYLATRVAHAALQAPPLPPKESPTPEFTPPPDTPKSENANNAPVEERVDAAMRESLAGTAEQAMSLAQAIGDPAAQTTVIAFSDFQ